MQSSIIRRIGQIHVATLLVEKNGVILTGKTPTLKIVRNSDNFFLDFGTNDWVSTGGSQTLNLPEVVVDGSNQGVYRYEFDPLSTNPNQIADEGYVFIYNIVDGSCKGNSYEFVQYKGLDESFFNVKKSIFNATADDVSRNLLTGMLDYIEVEFYDKADTSLTTLIAKTREYFDYDSNNQVTMTRKIRV